MPEKYSTAYVLIEAVVDEIVACLGLDVDEDVLEVVSDAGSVLPQAYLNPYTLKTYKDVLAGDLMLYLEKRGLPESQRELYKQAIQKGLTDAIDAMIEEEEEQDAVIRDLRSRHLMLGT